MNGRLHRITSCEVCGSNELHSVLDLGAHPMCDDLVPMGDSRSCHEYPIEIMLCATCRTAHQRFQIPKHDLFPRSYHYRSRFTADVLNGMAGLVESCESRYGSMAGKTVLDIGCNDGSLLDCFRAKGASTIGIEPTGASEDARQKGHVVFDEYLSKQLADAVVRRHAHPDFITFTNVFAHIEDLAEVTGALRRLTGPHTVTVIENHYLGTVLKGNQFDTFYHEHPRTYSYSSFVHVAKSLGMSLRDAEFPSRYGGNIRVFLECAADDRGPNPARLLALENEETRYFEYFGYLRANIERWRDSKTRQIQGLIARYGRLRAKAFPGRAAILVKLLGLTDKDLEAVYEKPGSPKIGNYLPGTRIPILADDALFGMPDQSLPVLNLAWHITQEIRLYMAEHRYLGPVIDILGAEDFPQAS